ncbi:MAG: Lrp/AsnC family transcriptional regulator [Tissierellia bacterium]|nr:Lrp/AsnC family transcriptional regulator [Tissierellia bacterium]
MDELDMEILKLLENNGRMTHEEIGRRLHISRPAIHQRVAKLEQKNIIQSYHAKINWSALGQVISAIVFINVRTLDFNKTMKEILDIQIDGLTIEECYRITGQWCLMLKVRAELTDQITALHDELLKMEGMQDTFTMLILSKMTKE